MTPNNILWMCADAAIEEERKGVSRERERPRCRWMLNPPMEYRHDHVLFAAMKISEICETLCTAKAYSRQDVNTVTLTPKLLPSQEELIVVNSHSDRSATWYRLT